MTGQFTHWIISWSLTEKNGGWIIPLKFMAKLVGKVMSFSSVDFIRVKSWRSIFTKKMCWFQPLLTNISQLGWLFPIYGKTKNVPNPQPAKKVVVLSEKRSRKSKTIKFRGRKPSMSPWNCNRLGVYETSSDNQNICCHNYPVVKSLCWYADPHGHHTNHICGDGNGHHHAILGYFMIFFGLKKPQFLLFQPKISWWCRV